MEIVVFLELPYAVIAAKPAKASGLPAKVACAPILPVPYVTAALSGPTPLID